MTWELDLALREVDTLRHKNRQLEARLEFVMKVQEYHNAGIEARKNGLPAISNPFCTNRHLTPAQEAYRQSRNLGYYEQDNDMRFREHNTKLQNALVDILMVERQLGKASKESEMKNLQGRRKDLYKKAMKVVKEINGNENHR